MSTLTEGARVNFAACVAMLVAATTCMAARFAVRLSMGQRPLGADWVCLLSLAIFYGYCAVIIDFIFRVSKFHAFDADFTLGVDELMNLLKASYILEILMSCIITTAKFSLLWFYHTIFSVYKFAKYSIYGVAAACAVWFVVVLFVIIFQCSPIDAMWTSIMFVTQCLPTQRMLLGYEVTNLLLDVAVLAIPIFSVRQLQLTKGRRISIMVIFTLGAFVCVASIMRLVAIWHPNNPDQPVDFQSGMLWSTIQLGTALVCCCIPTLAPLLRVISKPYASWQGRYKYGSSKEGSGKSSERGHGASDSPSWIRLEQGQQTSRSWAKSSHHDSQDHILKSIPSNSIRVAREVEVRG